MTDFSDKYRATLEDVRAELLDTGDGDWLPGTSRAHQMLDAALKLQNPNSLEIEIRPADHGYEVRCHGANGILTIGAADLPGALDAVARWAKREAESRDE